MQKYNLLLAYIFLCKVTNKDIDEQSNQNEIKLSGYISHPSSLLAFPPMVDSLDATIATVMTFVSPSMTALTKATMTSIFPSVNALTKSTMTSVFPSMTAFSKSTMTSIFPSVTSIPPPNLL